MNRRTFLHLASSLLGGAVIPLRAAETERNWCRHLPGTLVSAPDFPLPARKRVAFGWKTATVAGDGHAPVVLSWPSLPVERAPTRFRIAVGLDERDEKLVQVSLPKSRRVVGIMDLRFVSQFQVYELRLTPSDVAGVRKEGLVLRLTKGSELEIITGGKSAPAPLLPHLLVPGTEPPAEEFFRRLNSLACVQQFGWMEGCVLDGLLDLAALPAHAGLRVSAQNHLGLFFKDGQLIYENHVCEPSDGRIYGIEGTLPFAALARVEPDHPALDLAVSFWRSRQWPDGVIQDGSSMSSEGAYTVGYALAEVARARRSEELMQLALTQVRVRQATLFDGREFWRTHSDDDRRGNRNWARGIAWQILGLTRTLGVAKDHADVANLVASLRPFAEWAIALQREDGLWSVFADNPSLTPDTAGSAGIAAALAIAANHGWLDDRAKGAAAKTLAGLRGHLTADGFLDGVSQSNKGGEALQRSAYRSIFQMGMGLMAQLTAALD